MKTNQKFLSFILVILWLMQLCQSKFVTKSVYLSSFSKEKFKYLTKFSMNLGEGNYEVRAKFDSPINERYHWLSYYVFFNVFLDNDWPQILETQDCNQKKSFNRQSHGISVPLNGDWSDVQTGSLNQYHQMHHWYFTISDCDSNYGNFQNKNSLINENDNIDNAWAQISRTRITFEIKIKNTDGSEFPVEEQYLLVPTLLVLIASVIFFIYNIQTAVKDYNNNQEQADWALILTTLALFLEIFGLFFEFLHMQIYALNGSGVFVFNLLNNICAIMAQFLVTVIFILISMGWTITFKDVDEKNELLLPVQIIIGVIHVLVVGLGRISDDAHNKNHDYEGVHGWILIVIRILLFIYFEYNIQQTINQQTRSVTVKFLTVFNLIGSIYFLAFPILIFIGSYIADYVRHAFISIGLMITQMLIMVILSRIFTNKKGSYYECSYKGKSIMDFKLA